MRGLRYQAVGAGIIGLKVVGVPERHNGSRPKMRLRTDKPDQVQSFSRSGHVHDREVKVTGSEGPPSRFEIDDAGYIAALTIYGKRLGNKGGITSILFHY